MKVFLSQLFIFFLLVTLSTAMADEKERCMALAKMYRGYDCSSEKIISIFKEYGDGIISYCLKMNGPDQCNDLQKNGFFLRLRAFPIIDQALINSGESANDQQQVIECRLSHSNEIVELDNVMLRGNPLTFSYQIEDGFWDIESARYAVNDLPSGILDSIFKIRPPRYTTVDGKKYDNGERVLGISEQVWVDFINDQIVTNKKDSNVFASELSVCCVGDGCINGIANSQTEIESSQRTLIPVPKSNEPPREIKNQPATILVE